MEHQANSYFQNPALLETIICDMTQQQALELLLMSKLALSISPFLFFSYMMHIKGCL
jgi:hypothetical protein